MITNQEATCSALTDVIDMIERGEKTGDIVTMLDRDHSMPPTDGRHFVVYARSLYERIQLGLGERRFL